MCKYNNKNQTVIMYLINGNLPLLSKENILDMI